MDSTELDSAYHAYIRCLNEQNWPMLHLHVHENVQYNDRLVKLAGYRQMLENDFLQIPDLHFNVQLLVTDSLNVAARLGFDCSPKGVFLGLPVNGKKVRFTENVFYQFHEGRIHKVWSVIDKAAIEAQL